MLILLLPLMLWGCNHQLSGKYSDAIGATSYEFKPDLLGTTGTVVQKTLGFETQIKYEVSGDEIRLVMPGAHLLMQMNKNGTIDGPLGVTLRKE